MWKIKNGGLDQYGLERFEQQQFLTAGIEGVNEIFTVKFFYYLNCKYRIIDGIARARLVLYACRVFRDEQYFYSVYVPPAANQSLTVTGQIKFASTVSGSTVPYCGPIGPSQILNPLNELADEFLQSSPVLAKFLRTISSNACMFCVIFILSWVYK